MDREKLNKAAYEEEANTGNPFVQSDEWWIRESFKNGADWLMQQPLSERLTEEEKEKFLDMYRWTTECTDNEEAAVTQTVLENIFGPYLFNEK